MGPSPSIAAGPSRPHIYLVLEDLGAPGATQGAHKSDTGCPAASKARAMTQSQAQRQERIASVAWAIRTATLTPMRMPSNQLKNTFASDVWN